MKRVAIVGFDKDESRLFRRFFSKGDLVFVFDNAKQLHKFDRTIHVLLTNSNVSPSSIGFVGSRLYWMMLSDKHCPKLYEESMNYGVNDFITLPESFRVIRQRLHYKTIDSSVALQTLTPTERKIFDFIRRRKGGVPRQDIIDLIWAGEDKGLRQIIYKIKKKIAKEGYLLVKYGASEIGIIEDDRATL